jgi:hypothetical protein
MIMTQRVGKVMVGTVSLRGHEHQFHLRSPVPSHNDVARHPYACVALYYYNSALMPISRMVILVSELMLIIIEMYL